MNLPNNQNTSASKQRGAVLIVAMVMLLILTILGVAVLESSVLEEKMAGNAIDDNIAFQTAEAGLRAGEAWVASLGNRPSPKGILANNSVNKIGAESPFGQGNWWVGKNLKWWEDYGKPYNTDFDDTVVAETPHYMVEEYGVDCDGVANPSENSCKIVYRITAIAWGQTENSMALLQSLYARRF